MLLLVRLFVPSQYITTTEKETVDNKNPMTTSAMRFSFVLAIA